MNAEIKVALEQVKDRYEELAEGAKSETTRIGLLKIHQACTDIVEHAKQIPSVNQVVLEMTRKFGKDNHPAAQTIRNKRNGGNPYKQLFDAWKTAAIIVVTKEQNKSRSSLEQTDMALSHSDLHTIDDPTLKLQVTLLLQYNKRIKNQLDILRQVEGKPQIRQIEADGKVYQSIGGQKSVTGGIELNSQEKKALNHFTDEKQMAYRGYQWTEHGSLKARNGEMVGKPGLLSALQKLQEPKDGADSA